MTDRDRGLLSAISIDTPNIVRVVAYGIYGNFKGTYNYEAIDFYCEFAYAYDIHTYKNAQNVY
jgi:hypothetical protein